VRKPVGWDKDSLVGKEKAALTSEANKEFTCYFSLAGRWLAMLTKAVAHYYNYYLRRQML